MTALKSNVGNVPDNKMLKAALDYAARRIPVFPCNPHTKQPLTKKEIDPETGIEIPNSGGLRKATTDEEQITAWWTKWPNAMIGVPTGPRAGFWALDPDAPDGPGKPDGRQALAALEATHGKLPATHTHLTPGGGKHLLFKWQDDKLVTNREGAIAKQGINVRGDGGYLVVPPSEMSSGKAYTVEEPLDYFRFAAAPAWLYDLILAPKTQSISERAVAQVRQPESLNLDRPQQNNRRYAEAALRSEADAVASAAERNNQLNTSALKLGSLVAAGELGEAEVVDALYSASVANGYVASDGHGATMATINSGLRKGLENPRRIPERSRRSSAPINLADERKRRSNDDDSHPEAAVITEDTAALSFLEAYQNRLLYSHGEKCWYVWTGLYWERESTDLTLDLIREHVRGLTELQPPLIQQKCNKPAFTNGVEKFSRADRVFATRLDSWDPDKMLIGTPSGTVDLRTGELFDARPGDRITRLTAVGPLESATCPVWMKFLEDATGGDIELMLFLQQWCGYSLTGLTREHALIFIYGGGGNGKSVFLNTIGNVLGMYAVTASMDTFAASKNEQHPTSVARLNGARMVSASETEQGRAWAESRIKSLTGGDKIAARFMHKDFFEFTPQFKLIVVGNHKPVLQNVDDAARRRFNIVPFNKKPTNPDRELETKLREEWSGILRWMIDGCLHWQKHGLMRPTSVTESTASYFSDQDLLGQWLAEKCDAEPGNTSKSDVVADLFSSWSQFSEEAGEKAGTKKAFNEALTSRGYAAKRGTAGLRMFTGLRLKQPPGFGHE